eukprot:6171902-Pleurochrysis_carterae.AAC.2
MHSRLSKPVCVLQQRAFNLPDTVIRSISQVCRKLSSTTAKYNPHDKRSLRPEECRPVDLT